MPWLQQPPQEQGERAMDIMLTLAALAFLVATIWFIIGKAWPHAFVSAGLTLMALDMSNLFTS